MTRPRLVALGASGLVALCALGVFQLWWRHLRPPLTGDEPHYFVVARSIAVDHDLDLRNDYHKIDSVYPGLQVAHHAVAMRSDGRLRPIQGIGLGFVLSPAWWFASDPRRVLVWARRIMILIAAALVGETHWLARRLQPERTWTAWVASGAMTVALPFVGYSNQLYPEIPAALLAVTALAASRRCTVASRLIVGTCAGLLPWMSPRYAPIAIGLIAWEILGELRRAGWSRRVAPAIVPILLPALLFTAALAGWYQYAFGTVSLERIYRAAGLPIGHSALTVYERSVGSLFDPVGGLLPYAPVLLLGFVGLGALWRLRRDATVLVGVVGIVYLVAFAPAGFRGYALTGRMAIVMIPILALGVAALVGRGGRITAVALLAVFALGGLSLAITVQSAHRDIYGDIYKTRLTPAAPIVARLDSIWPRFVADPPSTRPDGSRVPASARHAPVRREIPVTAAWVAALLGAAALVARDPSRRSTVAAR